MSLGSLVEGQQLGGRGTRSPSAVDPHDWAGGRRASTSGTVRQISEQLRRFLTIRSGSRIGGFFDLVRAAEATALELRCDPPDVGLECVDDPGIEISLPFERPLYSPPPASEVESLIPPAEDADLEADLLFNQTYIDSARLVWQHPRPPARSTALLSWSDIIAMYPIEQGAAELVGYLALSDDDIEVEMDDSDETLLQINDPEDPDHARRIRLAEGDGEANMSDAHADRVRDHPSDARRRLPRA